MFDLSFLSINLDKPLFHICDEARRLWTWLHEIFLRAGFAPFPIVFVSSLFCAIFGRNNDWKILSKDTIFVAVNVVVGNECHSFQGDSNYLYRFFRIFWVKACGLFGVLFNYFAKGLDCYLLVLLSFFFVCGLESTAR